MTKEKKITLNAEKRKVIADQFQSFYENKVKDKLVQAKEQYDLMREKAKVAIEKVVRFHQPQEDVDTIRRMISKYSSSGGELYHDNCFNITMPITKVDDQGKEYQADDSGQAFRGNGKLTPEQAEMRRLKEENKRLKMEKDVLKKATVFFAKETK